MKACLCFTLALWWLARSAGAYPDSFVRINVSVKCIVNPATGSTPAAMNDAALRDCFDDINRWLAVNWRGFRVRLVDMNANDTFKRIGSAGDTTGPGKWYNLDLKENETNNTQFENQALANKTTFVWNDHAVNIYFNNAGWSRANFPEDNKQVVISAYGIFSYDLETGQTTTSSYKIGANLLHEIGHFFEVYHTHGGRNAAANDDGLTDTALDAPSPSDAAARNESGVRNSIAQLNYAVNYSALSTAQKVLVDNSANNAMSYHQLFYDYPAAGKVVPDAERFGPTRFLFTEQQMDRWTDYANNQRLFATSGRTWFVDGSVVTSGSGTSAAPIKTLAVGVNNIALSGNDILMLRPGTYTAATLSRPMTIRATRRGAAFIQKP